MISENSLPENSRAVSTVQIKHMKPVSLLSVKFAG